MNQHELTKVEDTDIVIANDNLFSSKNWIDVLKREYKFEFYYFVLNKVNANIIPFAVVNNLKGRQVISLPFCDYISTDNITKKDYLIFINYLREKYSTIPITLKTTFDDTLSIGKIIRKAYYHTIDLVEEKNYSSAFERGLKKSKNAGLAVVHYNTLEGLRKFYNLYARLRIKKFKSIPQPFSFFMRIFDVFISNGLGEIIHILHEGKTIAALIALKNGKSLFYKFGASDLNSLHLRPNNLLFDYLIDFAKESDFETLDLGLSGVSSAYDGLRRFKEGMGGIKKGITYYRIDPENYDNSFENKVSELLGTYTRSLVESDLKLEEIEKASSLIYRNFA